MGKCDKDTGPGGSHQARVNFAGPASVWADIGAEGRNSSVNRFALVHVVRHGSLKVHTATFYLGLSNASELSANPCGSGLAREDGGTVNIDVA